MINRNEAIQIGARAHRANANFHLTFFRVYALNPQFWFNAALYFVAATPFEFAQSGTTFLIRLSCIACLVGSLWFSGKIRLSQTQPMVLLALLSLLAANVFAMTDRAIMAFALILATATLAQVKDWKWREQLQYILAVYLAVNAAGLTLQIVALWGAGILLDLHGMIFPAASRIESIGQYGRLSGFHNEPGTFAQWMLMALFLRCLITGRLLTVFNIFVCGMIVATVSLWGAIGATMFAVAVAIEAVLASKAATIAKNIGVLLLSLLVIVAIASQVPNSVVQEGLSVLQAKAGFQSETGTDKLLAIDYLQSEFWKVLVLGGPISANDGNSGFCPSCSSPNDVGIWANGIYHFGFLYALALGLALGWRVLTRSGFAYLPLLAMMLTWKAPFYDPALWMLIGVILGGTSARPEETSK